MAITKRPSKQTADTEKAAEAFISKAGNALPANGKTPVLFRFKNDFSEKDRRCRQRTGTATSRMGQDRYR
jgi:hypothetical protein